MIDRKQKPTCTRVCGWQYSAGNMRLLKKCLRSRTLTKFTSHILQMLVCRMYMHSIYIYISIYIYVYAIYICTWYCHINTYDSQAPVRRCCPLITFTPWLGGGNYLRGNWACILVKLHIFSGRTVNAISCKINSQEIKKDKVETSYHLLSLSEGNIPEEWWSLVKAPLTKYILWCDYTNATGPFRSINIKQHTYSKQHTCYGMKLRLALPLKWPPSYQHQLHWNRWIVTCANQNALAWLVQII